MRRLSIFLLLIVNMACVGNRYKLETVHPSDERMHELLNAPVKLPKGKELKFEVSLSPAVILSGSNVRVICRVPGALSAYKIRLGIPGLGMHEGPIESAETSLTIERVACGEYVAMCDILTPSGQQHREANLIAKGECNSGTSAAEKGQRQ